MTSISIVIIVQADDDGNQQIPSMGERFRPPRSPPKYRTVKYRRFIMKRLLVLSLIAALFISVALPVAVATISAAPAHDVDLKAPAVLGQFLVKFKAGTAGSVRASTIAARGGRVFKHIAALDV